MHRWPNTFPLPKEDYSIDGSDNTFRTQMDSGAYRQRRRYTVPQTQISVAFSLDDFQFAWFRAFHRYQLNAGADWFLMTVPVGGAVVERQVRFVGGKFNSEYEPVSRWRLSAKLDVKEEPVMSSAASAALLLFGGSVSEQEDLIATSEELHNCVHTTLFNNLN